MGARNVPPISVRDASQWQGPLAPLKDVTSSPSLVLIAVRRCSAHSVHSASCFCECVSLSVCKSAVVHFTVLENFADGLPLTLLIFLIREVRICHVNGEAFFFCGWQR